MAVSYAPPLVIVPAGGIPITLASHALAAPFTVVTNLAPAATLVAQGGLPVLLLNPDGTPYVP